MPLYVALFSGVAGVLVVVAAVASAFASADDNAGRSSGSERVSRQARLAARRAAHPLAFGLQLACTAAAGILMLAWLAYLLFIYLPQTH